jgi:lysophospholipase L1-like esterase
MKCLPILVFGVAFSAGAICSAAEKSGFYLKEGDRVVFYGDSITDQRLYTTFAETFVITRFPEMHVQFVHSGWGGDTVNGGGGGPIDTRLKRDVFAYNPTVMTIMLGMNDGSYRAFDQAIFDKYRKGYEHIVASVKETVPNIRLTLIRPSPFDDVAHAPKFEGGYNQVLVRYGEFVKELADRNGATVADLNAGVVAALEKAKDKNPTVAKQLVADQVHPGAAGQLLMANELLKAWHAPAVVSDVEIDASAAQTLRTEGAKVTNLKGGDTVSWKQQDSALPFPIGTNDQVMALAVSSSDVVNALDKQMLKVTGLKADSYVLKIDGNRIGTFDKEKLAAGVNLALLPTPMFNQAKEVHALTLQHNQLHFNRWRQIQVPLDSSKNSKVQKSVKELLAALDEEEADVVKKQRDTARPKPHQFELAPAS